MQDLYAASFSDQNKLAEQSTVDILNNQSLLDQKIQNAAPDRQLDQMNKIDLAIMRLAAYELLIDKHTPYKVVIDEAVELAKVYGSDHSAQFVNGALGKIVAEEKLDS
jgi:transcription antitermination protein NusB